MLIYKTFENCLKYICTIPIIKKNQRIGSNNVRSGSEKFCINSLFLKASTGDKSTGHKAHSVKLDEFLTIRTVHDTHPILFLLKTLNTTRTTIK